MTDPVLERSVLERKERDELQTIAKALGAKPSARAKKADLVDLILTTAGIDTGSSNGEVPAERAPAPTRVVRSAKPAVIDDAIADLLADEEALVPASNGSPDEPVETSAPAATA